MIFNLNIKYNALSVFVGIVCAIAAFAFLCARKIPKSRKRFELSALIPAFSAVAVLCVLCCAFPFKFCVSDGVHYYTFYPRVIAASGSLPYYYSHYMSSIGQLEPMLAAFGYLFSVNLGFSSQTALLACVYAYIARRAVRCVEGRHLQKMLTFAAVLCFMAFQPALLLIQVNLWSNAYGAAYMFFCAALINRLCTGEGKAQDMAALAVILPSFAFARLEGFAYMLMLFMVLAACRLEGKKLLAYYLLPSFALYGLLFINLYIVKNVPDNPTFLSRGYAAIILALYLAAAVYALVLRERDLLKMRSKIWTYILAGLVLLTALGAAVHPDKFIVDVRSTLTLTLSAASWGTWGAVLAVAYIAALVWSRFDINAVDVCAVGYPLLVLAICVFVKPPFSDRETNSANRLFIQAIPLACLAIVEKLIMQKKGTAHDKGAVTPKN